ncbi:MAG: glycosyltransferase, partial [Ignavibacteria bacterium]|nr:glycosyltransferase [Ignavibacteria bacterium]
MKKVLVISYYFPPLGMGGVQRTAKFCKYLGSSGYEPYVLATAPKSYYAFDNTLLEELESNDVKIFRTGEYEGGKIKQIKFKAEFKRKLLSKLVQVFLLPDTKILWKSKALELGREIIKFNNIDLIFATAPPYTDFLIGRELSEEFKLPLVIDYRDAWYDSPYNYYATPLHKLIHKKFEKDVLEKAGKIITINEKIKDLIESRYKIAKEKGVEIITQGFDPEDIEKANDTAEKLKSEKKRMRFCYAGSFFNLMTPEYFLKAMKIVFDKIPEAKENMEAYFIGLFPEEHRQTVRRLGLENNVVITGYKNHLECISYELSSDVLWLMIGRSRASDMISTGKLYEYIGTGRPILACLPDG